MDQDGIGPSIAQAIGGFLTSVSGAVVHNPKDPTSRLVGFLAHNFAEEPIHWSYPAFHFAATEDLGAIDVPRC